MPGKSRHGRQKVSRSKRKKGKYDVSAVGAQQQVAAQTYEAVSHPEASPPAPSRPVTRSAPPTTSYPYIGAELKRVGILAGIILVILVILTSVLS